MSRPPAHRRPRRAGAAPAARRPAGAARRPRHLPGADRRAAGRPAARPRSICRRTRSRAAYAEPGGPAASIAWAARPLAADGPVRPRTSSAPGTSPRSGGSTAPAAPGGLAQAGAAVLRPRAGRAAAGRRGRAGAGAAAARGRRRRAACCSPTCRARTATTPAPTSAPRIAAAFHPVQVLLRGPDRADAARRRACRTPPRRRPLARVAEPYFEQHRRPAAR